MLNPDQSCILAGIRPALPRGALYYLSPLVAVSDPAAPTAPGKRPKQAPALAPASQGRRWLSSQVPKRHRGYLFVGLKMAPKWIDLSECMQCFQLRLARTLQAGESSCLHISSVSASTSHCIACLPPMTDTDASPANPPTNPFVCTHHLTQIPAGKSNQLQPSGFFERIVLQSWFWGGLLVPGVTPNSPCWLPPSLLTLHQKPSLLFLQIYPGLAF